MSRRPRSRPGVGANCCSCFPTIRHLEQLAQFASVDELIDHARGQEVLPVEPRVVLQGETARIVLPGEPGYEETRSG